MDNIEKEILSLYGKNSLFSLLTRLKLSLISFRKISRLLPKRGKICELGAGYGFEAVYLVLDHPERSVLGIDIDAQRVETANAAARKIPNLKFLSADINRTDLPKSDGILMVSFLHHLGYPEQENLVKRCYEALNQNGLLVVLDPVNHPPLKHFMNWLSDWVLYPLNGKNFFRSKEGLIELLSSASFKTEGEIEKDSGWGVFSYALVVGQKQGIKSNQPSENLFDSGMTT